jgi:pimeloyl-ACP methyl ester carboxylesterase
VVSHWSTKFDWRAQEAKLNQLPQFIFKIGDIDLHYLHVLAKGGQGRPLLLSHGWPGSIFEFMDLIPRLTDPERFGGSSDDAFTVGFHVVAVQIPLTSLADDVAATKRAIALQDGPVILAGHSYGRSHYRCSSDY